jgi:hypothetical protein
MQRGRWEKQTTAKKVDEGSHRITAYWRSVQLNYKIINTSCNNRWVIKKTRPAGGKTAPCGILLRRKVFSRRPRKLSNPSPPLHRGLRSPREGRVSATHRTVARPGLSLCFENEERRGSFFNPGQNSLPTGDWTRDLRSADRSSSPLRCKPVGTDELY